MVRPGVIPDTLALGIFERSRQFKQRLSLLHHFQQRWDRQSVLAIPDVPIVYADWAAPGVSPGESTALSSTFLSTPAVASDPAASTTAALDQVEASPPVSSTIESRDSASTQTSASAASQPLVVQAKFVNSPASDAGTHTPLPVASDSVLLNSPITQFITQPITQTMGQSIPQIIPQNIIAQNIIAQNTESSASPEVGDGNSALTPSSPLPIVTPLAIASGISDSVSLIPIPLVAFGLSQGSKTMLPRSLETSVEGSLQQNSQGILPLASPVASGFLNSNRPSISADAVLQKDQKDLPIVKVTNSAAQSAYSSAHSQATGKPHQAQFPGVHQPLVLARPAVGSLPTDTTLPEVAAAMGNRFSGRSPAVTTQPTVNAQPTPAMPSSASASLPASPQSPPVDVSRLTQQVERKLMRKLTVERERRGQRTW
jgi:hypothetical protein